MRAAFLGRREDDNPPCFDANTIGMAQTLRSWLRAGLIDELDPILLSVEDNRGDEGNGDNTNATEFAREEAGWE